MKFKQNAKAEIPVLWPPHAKSWLIGKDSDAGRDWGQEEKGTAEDEVAGWDHWLDGRESQWTPGVGDGQGGLMCCNSWGCKELDTTERLNWIETKFWQIDRQYFQTKALRVLLRFEFDFIWGIVFLLKTMSVCLCLSPF